MLASRPIALLCLLLLLASCGDDDAPVTGPVDLKVRLPPGAIVKFKLTSNATGTSPKYEGKTRNTEDGKEFEVVAKETDASGVVSAAYRWTHVWGRIWGLGPEKHFDSDEPAERTDPMFHLQTAMVGKELPFRIASSGEVQPIEGMTARVQEWFQGLPEAAMFQDSSQGPFSDDAMQKMVQQSLAPLPPRALKAGESWTFRTALMPEAGVELVYEGSGTLTAATTSTATLRLEGTLTGVVLPEIDPAKASPEELRRRMVTRPVVSEGHLVIESKVSRADGLVLEQTSQLRMHLSIKRVVEQPATEVDHVKHAKLERISR